MYWIGLAKCLITEGYTLEKEDIFDLTVPRRKKLKARDLSGYKLEKVCLLLLQGARLTIKDQSSSNDTD